MTQQRKKHMTFGWDPTVLQLPRAPWPLQQKQSSHTTKWHSIKGQKVYARVQSLIKMPYIEGASQLRKGSTNGATCNDHADTCDGLHCWLDLVTLAPSDKPRSCTACCFEGKMRYAHVKHLDRICHCCTCVQAHAMMHPLRLIPVVTAAMTSRSSNVQAGTSSA